MKKTVHDILVLLTIFIFSHAQAVCNYTHCIDTTQDNWKNVISCGMVSKRLF